MKGVATSGRQRGRGLIVNEVGNCPRNRGVASPESTLGCSTSLGLLPVPLSSFPAVFVSPATHINCIPSKISAGEMTHLRDRLSLCLVAAGHPRFYRSYRLRWVSTFENRHGEHLLGFYEKLFENDAKKNRYKYNFRFVLPRIEVRVIP